MTKQIFLKLTLLGLILGSIQVAKACDYDDDLQFDDKGEVTSASGKNGSITGAELDVIKKAYSSNTTNGCSGSKNIENLRKTIVSIMLVDPTQDVGGTGEKKYNYLNNVDSVRENQNKVKVSAATRAVALGKRAVALATKSYEDVDGRRREIEYRDDMLRMLKGIAKLQAQHLQKTSAITAMRAKLMELNAIDDIISGDVYTKTVNTDKK